MSEKKKSENVIDISRAKSFSNSSAKAFSIMSAMQKVTKRGDTRTTKPSQGRKYPGPRELRGSMPQMSLLDNDTPQGSDRTRLAETKLVEEVLQDIGKIRDIYQRHDRTEVVLALNNVIELIRDEYK